MALFKPTEEELAEILAKHKLWLESDGKDGARADLARANLAGANLAGADLARAYLADANLAGADLAGAYLARANLARANLAGANLADVKNVELALAMTEIVPREGSFVGWKKCRGNAIVKLRIPEDAKRSNATGRKCRASKVEVLDIVDAHGYQIPAATSKYDRSFSYIVGTTVEVSDFCENRLKECAAGIHFFLTEEEARAHIQ